MAKRMVPLASVLPKLPPPRQGRSKANSTHWRGISRHLDGLSLLEFQRLRICCPYCTARVEYCDICGGVGYVCPTCTGSHWLARRREGTTSALERCGGCGIETSSGWQYDPDKELITIEFWLEQWAAGLHPYVPKPPVLNPVQPGAWQVPPAPTPEEDAAIRGAFAKPAPAQEEEDDNGLPF